MRFKVINAATGAVAREFDDGHEAHEFARSLNQAAKNAGSTMRHKVRREELQPNPDWRNRERARFTAGDYTPAPWNKEQWFKESSYADLHFPHISKKDPGMVAFTESEEKGQQDLQLRMRAGKYLETYFAGLLNVGLIRAYASMVKIETSEFIINFATTPDDIEWVYKNGPQSCMSKMLRDYNLPVHPTRQYGAGDLAVAWVGCDAGRNIVAKEKASYAAARAICWPEKKWYGRMYGDGGEFSRRLKDELEATHGYSYHPDFTGARLLRLKHGNHFVCPFLDGNTHVRDDGQFLIIDNTGYFTAKNQATGLAIDGRQKCSICRQGFTHTAQLPRAAARNGQIGGYWFCDTHWAERIFFCNGCAGNYDRKKNAPKLMNGKEYCPSCYQRAFAECTSCHKTVDASTVLYARDAAGKGEVLCETCAHAAGSFKTCQSCNHAVRGELTRVNMRGRDRNICQFCLEDYPPCHACGVRNFKGDSRYAVQGTTTQYFCGACYPGHAFQCSGCQGHFVNSEKRKHGRWYFCQLCHDRRTSSPDRADHIPSARLGDIIPVSTAAGTLQYHQLGNPITISVNATGNYNYYQGEAQAVVGVGEGDPLPAEVRGGHSAAPAHPTDATSAPEQAGGGADRTSAGSGPGDDQGSGG